MWEGGNKERTLRKGSKDVCVSVCMCVCVCVKGRYRRDEREGNRRYI